MKNKLFLLLLGIVLASCGTTKLTATIHQPTDGSQSTISITTNTPITSNVEPNTNVEFKTSK